jgi:hypothetical protein
MLKGSMSGNARDCNNIETRVFLQGNMPKEIHAISDKNVKGKCTIVCHCQKLVAQFKRDFSTCDVPRPGQPKTVNAAEIIDQIHELILEDSRISAEQLGTLCERFGSIIHEDLDMRSNNNNNNIWEKYRIMKKRAG